MNKGHKMKRTPIRQLIGLILAGLLLVILFCGVVRYHQNHRKNIAEAALILDELKEAGFSFLKGKEEAFEKIAGQALQLLERLNTENADKESMNSAIKEVLKQSDLEVTEEELQQLAEWLVDYYTQNNNLVQKEASAELENTLVQQMQQDLTSIYEYLSQLDETVVTNKEEILNLTTVQEGGFSDINAYLDSLTKTITNLKDQFSEYENNYSDNQISNTAEFTSINLQLENITENIANTKLELSENIHHADNSNAGRYESLNSTVNHLASSLREDLESVNKNISKIINDMQKDNDEKNEELTTKLQETHEELLQVLNTMEKEWSDLLARVFADIDAHITDTEGNLSDEIHGTEKKLADDLKESTDKLTSQNDENKKNLSEEAEKNKTELAEQIEAAGENAAEKINDSQNNISCEIKNANNDLSEEINSAESEITSQLSEEGNRIRNQIDKTENNLSDKIDITQNEVQNQLKQAKNEISQEVAKNKAELAGQVDSTERNISDKINNFQNNINNKIEDSKNSLSGEINSAKSEISAQLTDGLSNAEEKISNQVGKTEKNLADKIGDSANGLSGEITAAQAALSEQFLSQLEKTEGNIMNQVERSENEMTAGLNDSKTLIQGQISGTEKILTQGIDTGVNLLLTNLDSVHADITVTQEEIKNILKDMDQADEDKMAGLINRFTGVNNKLVEINTAMDQTHGEIKNLISSLQDSAEKNQEKLLEALSSIDTSFSSQNSENYELLVNSLQTQTDTVQQWFDSLNSSVVSNFENLTNTVTSMEQKTSENKDEVLNNLNQSFTSLSVSVGNIGQAVANNKDEIMNRISQLEINTEDHYNKLSADVQSVFQRASDGKKLLASALLAKNVSVREDATFREIYDSILKIDQQIVIGVEQVLGTITYDYHYHTGDSVNGGGCYTSKLYHQHGPECYAKATCTVTVHANGGFWSEGDDWCPCHGNVHRIKQNVIRKHSSCGAADNYGQISFTEHHGPGTDGFNGYDSSTHSYDKISCGKTNATFVGWDVGCGMVDGQIIGAHIVYDPTAQKSATASKMMTNKAYIPKRYDDYVLIPNSGAVGDASQEENCEETESTLVEEEMTETMPEETKEENSNSQTEAETEGMVETETQTETEMQKEETSGETEAQSESPEVDAGPDTGSETEEGTAVPSSEEEL